MKKEPLWQKTNIFNFNKRDATMYIVFYIVLPVFVTWFTLKNFPKNQISAVYCYVSILISALNCFYDACNRWKTGRKTFLNTKLIIMLVPVSIIGLYCLFEILGILIVEDMCSRIDGILYGYIITAAVALAEFWVCIAKDLVLKQMA